MFLRSEKVSLSSSKRFLSQLLIPNLRTFAFFPIFFSIRITFFFPLRNSRFNYNSVYTLAEKAKKLWFRSAFWKMTTESNFSFLFSYPLFLTNIHYVKIVEQQEQMFLDYQWSHLGFTEISVSVALRLYQHIIYIINNIYPKLNWFKIF